MTRALPTLASIALAALLGCQRDVELGKAKALEGCCGVYDDGKQCSKCPLLESARVTRAVAKEGCAGTCTAVVVETEGPNGRAECTYYVMARNGRSVVGGDCHEVRAAPSP